MAIAFLLNRGNATEKSLMKSLGIIADISFIIAINEGRNEQLWNGW
jgi:hypothetical protein